MSPELSQNLRNLVETALAGHTSGTFPRAAYEKEQALLIYATDAMYAYYLGVDGSVYEMDMDKFMAPLERVTDAAMIKKVYAAAIEAHPELAGLA